MSVVLLALSIPAARADVTFAAPDVYPLGGSLENVAVADLNKDGRPDLVVVCTNTNKLSVLFNKGNGTFYKAADYATGSAPEWVTLEDLNGDGYKDMAVVNASANTVSVFLSTSVPGVYPAVGTTYSAGSRPFAITAGRLSTSTGSLPDLVVTNLGSSSGISVLRNLGGGVFAPAQYYPTNSLPKSVALEDYNRDGKRDAVTANFDGTMSVLLGNGDRTFRPQSVVKVTGTPYTVTPLDVNGDGKLDLIAADYANGGVMILQGNGDGTFAPGGHLDGGSGSRSIAVGDFDKDGQTDFATADYLAKTISVYVKGDQAFLPFQSIDTGMALNSIVVADLNNDGLSDIAAVDTSGSLIVLRNTSVFVSTLTLSPASIGAGSAGTGTITLNGAAPAEGALVELAASGDPLSPVASVPPTVTIPAGQSSVRFDVVGRKVGSATVTATYNNRNKSAALTVTTGTTTGGGGLNGDMDSDGKLTLNDVVILLRTISGDGVGGN